MKEVIIEDIRTTRLALNGVHHESQWRDIEAGQPRLESPQAKQLGENKHEDAAVGLHPNINPHQDQL